MKLQTSGVLGTSYAIAKLAPKRDTPKYRVDVLLEPGDVVYISVADPQSNFKELGGGLQIELPRWTTDDKKLSRFPHKSIIKL